MDKTKKETTNRDTVITVTTKDNKKLELTMTEPLALHMMAIDEIKGDVTREVNLIASLTGVESSVIANLPLSEYAKLSQAVKNFL